MSCDEKPDCSTSSSSGLAAGGFKLELNRFIRESAASTICTTQRSLTRCSQIGSPLSVRFIATCRSR